MAIPLYSKATTDTLLAAKYDASNPSGFISDAPIDGNTYGRNSGAWAIISGGGGWTPGSSDLDLGGYAIVNGGYARFSNTVKVSGSFGAVMLGGNDYGPDSILTLTDYSQTLVVGATGITFPDSTVQTTAAVAGPTYGDVFSMGIVKDVSWVGTGWQLTCEPVNPFLAYAGGMAVVNFDGSLFEWMSGMSTIAPWTYTTTTFGSTDYVYIQALSQKANNPCNFP